MFSRLITWFRWMFKPPRAAVCKTLDSLSTQYGGAFAITVQELSREFAITVQKLRRERADELDRIASEIEGSLEP